MRENVISKTAITVIFRLIVESNMGLLKCNFTRRKVLVRWRTYPKISQKYQELAELWAKTLVFWTKCRVSQFEFLQNRGTVNSYLLLEFLSSDYEIFRASSEPYFDTRDTSDFWNFVHSQLSGIKCTLFANLTTYYIAELAMNKISKIRYVSSVEIRFQRCPENFIITA